ncbi:PREDICTED: eukaryotic translation initiation factor 5B-like, partial [Priapulus caudatus]|uniref:Eukaryotic translation initiation factor 5B n=1 Tax=Priapulus caudatus TaxID=37621 RepID=A0ABM1F1L8_PRICU
MGKPKKGRGAQADDELDDIEKELDMMRLESGIQNDGSDDSVPVVKQKEKKKKKKKEAADNEDDDADDTTHGPTKKERGKKQELDIEGASDEEDAEILPRNKRKDKKKKKVEELSEEEEEAPAITKGKKTQKKKKKRGGDISDSEEDDDENVKTEPTTRSKKRDKKKNKKARDLSDDDDDEEEDSVQPRSNQNEPTFDEKNSKPNKLSAYAMLAIEDSDNDGGEDRDSDDDSVERPPTPEPKVVEAKPKKQKEKKGKKGKQKTEEDDIDALLLEIESKSSGKSKKGKKGKAAAQEMDVEMEEAKQGEEVPAENGKSVKKIEEAGEDVEVNAVVVDPEEEAERLEMEMKQKKKKKKGKQIEEKEEEPADEPGEMEEEGEPEDKEDVEEMGEEVHTVKTAAQKKAEKKERQKREAQKVKKKGKKADEGEEILDTKTEEKSVDEKMEETVEAKATETKEGEGEDNEDGEETEKKKEKTKKKKGKDDKPEKDKKKMGSKQLKVMQEALRKIEEEKERLWKEEEEAEKRAEEAERLREEKARLELEKKEKKKQKEKERKERLKAEGKLLTKSQRQAKARAEAMLESLKAQGFAVPAKDDEEGAALPQKKRPIYKDKRSKFKQQQKLERQASDEVATQEAEKTDTMEVEEAKKTVEEKKPEEEEVESWEMIEEEKEEVKVEEKPIVQKEEKPKHHHKAPVKAPSVEKEEKEEEEEDDDDEEDDEEEEESESEEESSSEEESDDERTPAQRAREKAAARIEKRKSEAEKNVSVDRLRTPIVCVLGHVDTGKTKILDKIRRTNVQDGEAGGITQQIGTTFIPVEAIQVQSSMVKKFVENGIRVPGLCVIDTPGHESFSNLRVWVVALLKSPASLDIMHGLEPQTIESINLLKLAEQTPSRRLKQGDKHKRGLQGGRPDVIDSLHGEWDPQSDGGHAQEAASKHKTALRTGSSEVVVTVRKSSDPSISLNVALFYENKDPRTYISLVPTSAHSGDGMGNLMALVVELSQTMLAKRVARSDSLQASVMEVKALPGLGTTVDVILVNGTLREGDTVIMGGVEGPIVSQVRGLLTPPAMKEMRVKNQWDHHKEITGAIGVKIIGKDLEKVLAGLPLFVAEQEDEIPIWQDEISAHLSHMLNSIKMEERGVYVQSSTLGSLEALLEFLKQSKIPYAGINIGPVHKKDVMKASTMIEFEPQFACILAFDVKVERDGQEMADSLGVRIFQADIIYHLFDSFTSYQNDYKKRKQEEFKHLAVFPCKLRVLPQFIFNSRDPIVLGVSVEAGTIKHGTPLCVPTKEFVCVGICTTITSNTK